MHESDSSNFLKSTRKNNDYKNNNKKKYSQNIRYDGNYS